MAAAATSKVFLAMQRIERDDGACGNAKFGQQCLRCWYFIGFLGDFDVGKHKVGIGGERTEHLDGGTLMEIVETAAQRLAVQRDTALTGNGAGGM